MLNIPKRLKYETINNSNDAISVDLHNGYKVIAITGKQSENKYVTTLFLKEKTIDNLIIISFVVEVLIVFMIFNTVKTNQKIKEKQNETTS